MFSLMILLLCFAVSTFGFHLITRYCRRGRKLNKLDGPCAYPIVGNLLIFNTICTNKLWEVTRWCSRRYYPISRYWFFTSAMVFISHPDDIEILFSSQKTITKGFFYDYLQPWLKTGLLTSTGDKWRQRRKLLTPAFHFNILKKYLEITSEEGQMMIQSLKSEGRETVQSLVPFCSKYTLNVICESAMGVSLRNMDEKVSEKYIKSVHDMGSIVTFRVPRPYITNWMINFMYKWGSLQRRTLETLHNFSTKVIKDRQEYHKNTNNVYLHEMDTEKESSDYVGQGKKKRLAMLDLLLEHQQKGLIDSQGIQEEVDTFTFEGHDTTGMAMAFTLFLLAENKSAQDRARTEVTEVLKKNNGKFDFSMSQDFGYLERCIKESLRLYPPVATMLRYTAEDLKLKHALIPADTHMMIHIFDTHRDPNFWTEPEKFDPDRFLTELKALRHPFAYIPFSAGPRNCIGQKFAMMELKSLISQILHNFYLEPIDRIADMKLVADIILRPSKPIRIKMIRIDKNIDV